MSAHSHAHILFPRRAFVEHDFAQRIFSLIEHYLAAQMHTAKIEKTAWRTYIKRSTIYIEASPDHRKHCEGLIDQLTGIRQISARRKMDELRCWHLHGIKIVLIRSFASDIAFQALARQWLV